HSDTGDPAGRRRGLLGAGEGGNAYDRSRQAAHHRTPEGEMNRRGFTLTELLMAMAVMAILGVALTRILVNDSRFVSRQDAMLSARQGARAALNSVLSELSMVADTV